MNMPMTTNLFKAFNNSWGYNSSSVARARLKVWDHRHESQPSWDEEHYDDQHSWDIWEGITCGNPDILDTMVYEVDSLMLLPEEKWIFIKNPVLTTEEVWQLCADESADEREDNYERHDDIDECWCYYEDNCDYDYDYTDYYDDYEEYFPSEYYRVNGYEVRKKGCYSWPIDEPHYVFSDYEMENAAEKWIEDAKVWDQTALEVARFEECEVVDGVPHPPEPEPCPLISDHHNRKAA